MRKEKNNSELQAKLEEIKREYLEKFNTLRTKPGSFGVQQASSMLIACDELASRLGIKFKDEEKMPF